MILKLYVNLFVCSSLIAYIVSAILASINQDKFKNNSFYYLITIVSLSFLNLPLEYAQIVFLSEESTQTDIKLRQKFVVQYIYLLFFTLAVAFIERGLFITSFILFLVFAVFFSKYYFFFTINVINFLIIIFYILFFVEG
jgi:hypothetical protein